MRGTGNDRRTLSTFELRAQKREEFRDYRAQARASVKEFYRLNHTRQTREFVLKKQRQYLSKDRAKMGIWEAMEYLNTSTTAILTNLPQLNW